MTTPPISPNPLGAEAPKEDQVPLATWSAMTAVAASIMWFSALTFLTSQFAANSDAQTIAQVNPNAFYVNFLVYGAVLGVAFTGYVAWALMAAIASNYRRGGLSIVAAFAGAVLSGGLTMVTRQMGGPVALAGLFGLGLLATLRALHRARKEASLLGLASR